MVKERISKKTPETPRAETIEQIVQRIKRDMIWVAVSAAVAVGVSLLAGRLIKL
jgi:hypothetical protein